MPTCSLLFYTKENIPQENFSEWAIKAILNGICTKILSFQSLKTSFEGDSSLGCKLASVDFFHSEAYKPPAQNLCLSYTIIS